MTGRERERDILASLASLHQKAGQIMTAQDDIATAVTSLTAFLEDLGNAVGLIKQRLLAASSNVDTTPLDNLITSLPAVQASVDALANPAATSTTTTSTETGTPAAAKSK